MTFVQGLIFSLVKELYHFSMMVVAGNFTNQQLVKSRSLVVSVGDKAICSLSSVPVDDCEVEQNCFDLYGQRSLHYWLNLKSGTCFLTECYIKNDSISANGTGCDALRTRVFQQVFLFEIKS